MVGGGAKLLFGKDFAEFGPRFGGGAPSVPLGSAIADTAY